MKDPKGSLPRDDLKILRDQVVHEFHLISEGIIDQVKQVAEGVVNSMKNSIGLGRS